jgi:hypothetical protein
MTLQVEPEECLTHFIASGTIRAALMVLTAASTSYVAGSTILPLIANGNSGSFLLTVNPSGLTILQGASAPSTVAVFSINGFTGKVALSATSSNGALGVIFQNNTLSLTAGATATTPLTVSVPDDATLGSHDIIVTGTGIGHRRTFSSSTLLSVAVASTATFDIHLDPSSITSMAGSTSTVTVIVTSLNGFAGNVTLTATIPFGFIAVMGGQNPVLVPANGTASTSLQITTTAATQPGTYTVAVTGTSGPNSYSETITITVTTSVVEALSLTGHSLASATNLTLYLQNTGDVPVMLQAYAVRDSLGDAWTLRNWTGPTIQVNSVGPANLLISLDCFECTYTGIFGLFSQYVAGRTYTVTLTTSTNTEFTFTITL